MAQFDQPYTLVCEEAGILAELVSETGPATRERLTDIARAAFRPMMERYKLHVTDYKEL